MCYVWLLYVTSLLFYCPGLRSSALVPSAAALIGQVCRISRKLRLYEIEYAVFLYLQSC